MTLTFTELESTWPLRFSDAWIGRRRYYLDIASWQVEILVKKRLGPIYARWHETWIEDE